MIYLNGILTTVAYLMGERTVNSSTSGPRTDFVQMSLEEAYHRFPWRWNRRTASLVPVLGSNSTYSVSCPATYDYEMQSNAHYFQGTTQVELTQIDATDKGAYSQGDNVYWITSASEGVFTFNTFESSTPITFVFQALPPVLDAAGTIGTAYPSKQTLALGARRYVKLGQNPDADISQEQAQFDQAISNDIAATQVPQPRKRRKMVAHAIGDF